MNSNYEAVKAAIQKVTGCGEPTKRDCLRFYFRSGKEPELPKTVWNDSLLLSDQSQEMIDFLFELLKLNKMAKNNYQLPELKEDRFIQGYVCAVCCMINMDGMVETRTKEMYRAGVGQLTYGALEKRGVPKNDLDVLQEYWNELH